MPSEVPDSANSMSCTASALPARTTSTKPRRISSEKCSTPPVCTTTGPATTAMRPPAFFTSRIICGDARDAAFDAALRRDVVAHEREAEAVAFAELRRHADAVVAADDRLARLDVAQLAALGRAAGGDDHGVHALLLDLDPVAAMRTCVRWLVVE